MHKISKSYISPHLSLTNLIPSNIAFFPTFADLWWILRFIPSIADYGHLISTKSDTGQLNNTWFLKLNLL